MLSLMFACPSVRLAPISALLLLAQPVLAQDLTLGDVLARAAAADPAIIANAARLGAASAAIVQADIRPRDTLGVEIENFAGTGAYMPVERSETTAWYERRWERGGKRAARIDTARSEFGLVDQRNRLRRLDLLAQIQTQWVEALAAQAVLPIAERRLVAARQIELEVGRRVARALDPLFAAERARTAVAQARIALDQAQACARMNRANLAAYWGGAADYRLDGTPFTALDVTADGPGEAPEVALLAAERDAATARVRLAETANVADPTARIGLRHFGQGNDVALVVGGSIPLGNRTANRGNIARAEAEAQAAEAEIAVARIEARREADRLVAERGLIATEIGRLDKEVLPSARRAVALVQDGFRRGGTAFTFLEVSQAQQAETDAQARRVDLLRRFHLIGVRLDRLTGRHLPFLSAAEKR